MADHGLLFSAPMVRALLEGRKTRTRRLLTPHNAVFGSAPRLFWGHALLERAWSDGVDSYQYLHVPSHRADGKGTAEDALPCEVCDRMGWRSTVHRLYPRVQVGDWVYAKETFCVGYEVEPGRFTALPYSGCEAQRRAFYRATDPDPVDEPQCHWKPSIHMPKWASRLWFEVTAVRVQRLQEISPADCFDEGLIPSLRPGIDIDIDGNLWSDGVTAVREQFAALWDSINSKHPWASNPWVIALSLKRVEVPRG